MPLFLIFIIFTLAMLLLLPLYAAMPFMFAGIDAP